jgi:hypothetical protein
MTNEDKWIDYLSKEIEAQTKNLMSFRERINFAVFIGPFVLLGALLYGRGVVPRINWSSLTFSTWIAASLTFLVAILSYITMGIACALIERHMWAQCNIWRQLIAEITAGREGPFTYAELKFEERLLRGYLWVYLAMVLAFGSAIALVLILREHTLPG